MFVNEREAVSGFNYISVSGAGFEIGGTLKSNEHLIKSENWFQVEADEGPECGRKPNEHKRKVSDALMRRKLSLRGRPAVRYLAPQTHTSNASVLTSSPLHVT
ncbi:unnamed protein product [Pleuronectes platessa]|uniref:Uncharacterized protein n=1 Tax=Pleuronectes platessa TaxID=8262 RepID=A0A9N7YT43_PLEPL|nr:unnamed protein product [Pleuronectes platessa]